MRAIKIGLAGFCALFMVDAGAVPITISYDESHVLSLWGTSEQVNRYSYFSDQDSRSSTVSFSQFDSSLGTLLNVELTLSSATRHPSRLVLDEDVTVVPTNFPFGAFAQDTERELHGFNLYAYYDARVAYRADYRLTVDPLAPGLFAPLAAEAAIGSCAHTEDLLGDIGDTEPYCFAGNNGSPLGVFNYDWGLFYGSDLAQFIGNGLLPFAVRMDGDMYGYCDDDDVGDYCRVNLAMYWDWDLRLAYTYEPGVPDTGGGTGGGGGDPVSVPEPATYTIVLAGLGLMAFARRRKVVAA